MGTAPPGSGSGKARGLRRRQGTVGFKLKIPARPQLSRQGPRPRVRRASPGPFDFRRPVPLRDASRLGGGLRPRPSPPRLGLRVPCHLPGPERAGARRRGQLWPSRPPPCVPGGSGEGRAWGGAGHSPPAPPSPLRDLPREPPSGSATRQGWGRTRLAPRAPRRPPEHGSSRPAPDLRPLGGRDRGRGGSPSSPPAPRPGPRTPAREPPGSPDPCLPLPGSHPWG